MLESLRYLLMLSLCFPVACGPALGEEPVDESEQIEDETSDDSETEEEEEDDDKDDEEEEEEEQCEPLVCADQCGTVTNECGESLDCGPCVDEERLEELAGWVDTYMARTASASFPTSIVTYGTDAMKAEVRQLLRDYRATDAGFVAALRHAQLESRIGHAAIYDPEDYTCSDIDGAGDGGVSRLGACAVPHPDGILVSHVSVGNPAGLSAGDLVVAVDGLGGDALYDWSLRRPVCGGGAASDQARREEAARSFFSAIPEGTELTVVSPDGDERIVEAPEPSTERAHTLYCRDPLGRPTGFEAKAELRPDGVGVIHLPGFVPVGGFDPNGDVQAQMEALEDSILAEFEEVRDADALIWDVRSNIGGASPVGFTIAGGMPGAEETPLARCTTRIPDTNPPEFNHAGPDYDLVPTEKFEFDGPVAVLTDGRTISAGDYFARAVTLGTDAVIVGTPTAGAYGGSGSTFPVEGDLGLVAAYDPFRCNDLEGDPLETRGVEPDVVVHYEPADLANGVDTVLERAVEELRR